MKKLIVLLFVFISSCCFGKVTFNREFAPSEGMVFSLEKPCRSEVCLNGYWEFQPIDIPSGWVSNQGEPPVLSMPQDGKWESVQIKIPSPWNVNSIGHDHTGEGMDSRTYPSYPEDWNKVKMGWVRKRVIVPDEWRGERVFLHLEAVAGDCRVLVNGEEVGFHFDTSMPVEFDITSEVKWGGENEILLGIRGHRLYEDKGKYGSLTYPTGSMWLWDAFGVWQDVFLLSKPQVHIEDVFMQSMLDKNLLTADVELLNDSDKIQNIQVDIPVYEWINHADLSKENMLKAPEISYSLGSEALRLVSGEVELKPGEKKIVTVKAEVNGRLKKWELWSRGKPNLYAVVAEVNSGGKIIDKKYQRFGWREIKLENGDLLLNGEKTELMHEGWHFTGVPTMSRRYAWGWYTLAKEAYANFIRPHAMPYPRYFYDMADEMGMLIIDEAGIFGSHCAFNYESEVFWERNREHVASLVKRDRNHPSIIGWSVSNEIRCVLIWQAGNDPAFQQEVYGKIFDLCKLAKSIDPTRQWVQSDGDKDLDGRLDVWTIHCGGSHSDVIPPNKLWGVTEGGSSYYGKPGYYEPFVGDRAYRSFNDRMDGLAKEDYNLVRSLRQEGADILNGWNLVWHGSKPIPMGLDDVSKKKLSLDDGVFFGEYVEGRPGIQPERIAPFSTTVNPGYDPSLPLYDPYPLYLAVRAAMHPDGPQACEWDHFDEPKPAVVAPKIEAFVEKISYFGNAQGVVFDNLKSIGVTFDSSQMLEKFVIVNLDDVSEDEVGLLRERAGVVVGNGGVVFLVGMSPETMGVANRILPKEVVCVEDPASSLVPNLDDERMAYLSYKELYFAEDFVNRIVAKYSLAGDFVEKSNLLLSRNNTDWRRWLAGAECSKTISIYRSELENKQNPVLVEYVQGEGLYVVSTLELNNIGDELVSLYRKILGGFGVKLKAESALPVKSLNGSALVKSLTLGRFGVSSIEEGMETEFIDEKSVRPFENSENAGKQWKVQSNNGDRYILGDLGQSGPDEIFVSYFSYWVHSPISLGDLLEGGPDLPKMEKACYVSDDCKVYLNGELLKETISEQADYRTLKIYRNVPLKKGWNHFLVKVVSDSLKKTDPGTIAVRLLSNNGSYDKQLKSAIEILE